MLGSLPVDTVYIALTRCHTLGEGFPGTPFHGLLPATPGERHGHSERLQKQIQAYNPPLLQRVKVLQETPLACECDKNLISEPLAILCASTYILKCYWSLKAFCLRRVSRCRSTPEMPTPFRRSHKPSSLLPGKPGQTPSDFWLLLLSVLPDS